MMLVEFLLFTAVATVSTVLPIYKVKHVFAKIYGIPILGFVFVMGYGVIVSWLLLNLFSFKSSVAGLGNLTSSVIFTVYIAYLNGKLPKKKKK